MYKQAKVALDSYSAMSVGRGYESIHDIYDSQRTENATQLSSFLSVLERLSFEWGIAIETVRKEISRFRHFYFSQDTSNETAGAEITP